MRKELSDTSILVPYSTYFWIRWRIIQINILINTDCLLFPFAYHRSFFIFRTVRWFITLQFRYWRFFHSPFCGCLQFPKWIMPFCWQFLYQKMIIINRKWFRFFKYKWKGLTTTRPWYGGGGGLLLLFTTAPPGCLMEFFDWYAGGGNRLCEDRPADFDRGGGRGGSVWTDGDISTPCSEPKENRIC